MPETKPSTFKNELAEAAVLASVIKFPPCLEHFAGLNVSDFSQSTFGQIFGVMRELAASGRQITTATVNWNLSEEEVWHFAQDWEEQWESLVAVIKECALRASIVRKLELDWAKAEAMSTPALVQKASDKWKEKESEGKPFKDLVEAYVPTLTAKRVEWAALQTEDDILKQQGTSLEYIVSEILPANRVTMLFGQEKSGKSIVALDLCKHIANGKSWLNRQTKKTPCLYIDLEDGIVGAYIGWLRGVGDEKVRFITIRTKDGVPALDDATLLALCTEVQPVIVLDSLHKLFTREKDKKGGSAWNSGDYEPVLEKIRQLCVAGATVILIHHSTKADNEQYRDSSAIGANVDFLFAVVGDEPQSGVKRIHLIGKPSRGAQPPTIHILAFPHIIEQGHLCVDAGLEKEDIATYGVAKEVRDNGPAESRTALWKRVGGRKGDILAAITKAVSLGYLQASDSGEINIGSTPLAAPESYWERAVPKRVPEEKHSSGTFPGTDELEGAY